MSGNKAAFCELNETFREMIELGNNAKKTFFGKERARLHLNDSNFVITDVFYILELKNNLLSIGQLQECDFAILIQSGKCHIYHPNRGLIIQSEMTTNKMFLLLANFQPRKEKNTCFHTTTSDLTHL